MKGFIGNFGPLIIEINGEGELYDRLCDELIPITNYNKKTNKDLKVIITDSKSVFSDFKPEYSSAKQHMCFNRDSFYYDEPVPFYCKNLYNNKICELFIQEKNKINLKRRIKKTLSVSINSRIEISYSLFWYIIQVLLLKENASFIHAGTFTSGCNKAIAFMGTGGSGKTSNMFQYLSKSEYEYLSEDFGIINDKGNVYLSPKTLSVYDSDIENESSILLKFKKSMTISNRFKWSFNSMVRKKNPMIKVPVRCLFEREKLSKLALLSKSFYIIRSDISEPEVRKIDIEELSQRLVNITLREMKKYVELINLINASAPSDYPYPSLEEFIASVKNIYLKAFNNSENYLLNLPFECTPRKVEEFITLKGLLS